ncbi:MAG TPA: serine hydrolase domain-containing protein [Thermoanaerobaculia bacterium]|jgi:CubicO group peptidase (beta-lactamase class C family)
MRSRILSCLTASLLVSAAAVVAGPPTPADSQALGRDVDAVFAEYAKPGSPGCSLAVVRDGAIVYEKGYGFASLENGVPLDPKQTVFDIGSTSKQFTAASVLLLAHDAKLSLDDDIHKYVPELPEYGTQITGTPVTLRHLLHHTSGIRDYINLMAMGDFAVEDYTTDGDALTVLARQKKLDFQPGSEHSYSNSGYFLLSFVVKRVSGKPLRDFAQERIFTPLGMSHTQFLNDHMAVVPHRATGYGPHPGGGFGVRHVEARDGKLFYVRGVDNDSELVPLGSDRFQMVGTTGTVVSFPPVAAGAKRRMQLSPGTAKPLVFQEEQPAALQPGDLAAYAGTYTSAELDTFWVLKVEDGRLVLHPKRGEVMPLDPAYADAFLGPAGVIRFQRDAGKKVTGFLVGVGRARDLQFTKGAGPS